MARNLFLAVLALRCATAAADVAQLRGSNQTKDLGSLAGASRTISKHVLYDKLMGYWVGQLVGNFMGLRLDLSAVVGIQERRLTLVGVCSTEALRVPLQRFAHAHRAAGLLRPAQRTLGRPQDQLRRARTHPPKVESTPGSLH